MIKSASDWGVELIARRVGKWKNLRNVKASNTRENHTFHLQSFPYIDGGTRVHVECHAYRKSIVSAENCRLLIGAMATRCVKRGRTADKVSPSSHFASLRWLCMVVALAIQSIALGQLCKMAKWTKNCQRLRSKGVKIEYASMRMSPIERDAQRWIIKLIEPVCWKDYHVWVRFLWVRQVVLTQFW